MSPSSRLRAASILVAVGALVAPVTPAPAGAVPAERANHDSRPWRPQLDLSDYARPPTATGPVFNDPLGSGEAQWAILDTVIAAYDSTPPGATIRQSSYTGIARKLVDSLLRAHRRGVHVRVVLDDRYRLGDAAKKLRRALGTDVRRRSFFVRPKGASRGIGVMHTKIFATSDVGNGRPAVMIGSSNAHQHDTYMKFNDLYVFHREDASRWIARLHNELAADRHLRNPYRRGTFGRFTLIASLAADRGRDDVVEALDRVQPGSQIFIAMHVWRQERGKMIARNLVRLHAHDVGVHVNRGRHVSRAVAAILASGRIDLEATGYRHGTVWPHNKYLVVLARSPRDSFVITGSNNFGNAPGDELTLQVRGHNPAMQYGRNFTRVRDPRIWE